MSGRLFIIATPVGNLSDLTFRIKEALQESAYVLAEDTRVSLRLLSHLGISKKLVSCHEFNEAARLDLLLEVVRDDLSIALVSDAGTPLVSDPGAIIVKAAIELGITTIPIPGPSAFLLALVASGLDAGRFCFEGFLPDKTKEAKKRLLELQNEERTMVFYVAPHDVNETLMLIKEILGDRRICLARELTKKFEEFIRGTISEILEREQKPRGEYVLVVEGQIPAEKAKASEAEIKEVIQSRLEDGQRLKLVATELAAVYGLSNSAIYKLGLDMKREQEGKNQDD